jgi:hypothetical protein
MPKVSNTSLSKLLSDIAENQFNTKIVFKTTSKSKIYNDNAREYEYEKV